METAARFNRFLSVVVVVVVLVAAAILGWGRLVAGGFLLPVLPVLPVLPPLSPTTVFSCSCWCGRRQNQRGVL